MRAWPAPASRIRNAHIAEDHDVTAVRSRDGDPNRDVMHQVAEGVAAVPGHQTTRTQRIPRRRVWSSRTYRGFARCGPPCLLDCSGPDGASSPTSETGHVR